MLTHLNRAPSLMDHMYSVRKSSIVSGELLELRMGREYLSVFRCWNNKLWTLGEQAKHGGCLYNENVRVAYSHPPSRSYRGLEGPLGPCWEPLAPS